MPPSRSSALATFALAAAVLTGAAPRASLAQGITDPAGDFLPSYVGPHNGDMDVLLASAVFDGSSFHFRSQQAGLIGTTPNAIFVWGVNRGAGTARFGPLAPGVLFDFVIALTPGGTSTARDLISGTVTNLAPGSVSFSGDIVTADVPLSLLPSQGFSASQYTVNLWPRTSLANNNTISDFAPDNSNFQVTTTPEPSTALLLGPALLGLGAIRRRRRGY